MADEFSSIDQKLLHAVRRCDCSFALETIAGADPNTRDPSSNKTLLMIATEMDNLRMASLLLKHKADANCHDKYGWTALHSASSRPGSIRMVRTLVEASLDIDLDVQTTSGFTPLMLACQNGATEVARFLISKGANVNIRDKRGYTALLLAAQNGEAELMQVLLYAGADKTVMDERGRDAKKIVWQLSCSSTQPKDGCDFHNPPKNWDWGLSDGTSADARATAIQKMYRGAKVRKNILVQ
eukprot:g5468.t1